jgi:hypothetical protein
MTVYTVHEPRPRKNEDATDPERFVFVRDGFYFWAFLLGPLWMLWRGLWLVLLLFVVASVTLWMGLTVAGLSTAVQFSVGFLVALLVGFEAASLRRWTFARRRWKNLGLVVAPDIESAERRFFNAWMAQQSVPRTDVASLPAVSPLLDARPSPGVTSVIGLFPEPEPRPRS